MKKIISLVLFACCSTVLAGTREGDVNFGTDMSTDNHAIKYQMKFSNGAITGYTACITPGTGYPEALTIAAMNGNKGSYKIVATDCSNNKAYTTSETFSYDPQYWYNIACTFDSKNKKVTCHY